MHIKRDISICNLKMILNVLFRRPGFSGRSQRLLTHCLLSATKENNDTLRKSQLTFETS